MKRRYVPFRLVVALGVVVVAAECLAKDAPALAVAVGADGKLVYKPDDKGNRIPDFSYCGYAGGGVAIPDVPGVVSVAPAPGDAGPRIQAAIDYVSALPADAHGFRGAVVLSAGRFPVSGSIHISTSGVVVRGQGDGPDGSVIVATGTGRRTLIEIKGVGEPSLIGSPVAIADAYVPVGAVTLPIAQPNILKKGVEVLVRRASPAAWIDAIGMHQFPGRAGGDFRFSWPADKMDVVWRRRITAIEGGAVTIDAPITTAMDAKFGGGSVTAYEWPRRIDHVGVEGLRVESEFDRANPLDEEHAWMAVRIDGARDGWIRQVTAAHFVSSAVAVWDGCDAITVEDCKSVEPVSEIGGYRRHSFYVAGQRTLFQRCHAEHGRRDFAVGYLAAGPNAFVACDASDAHDFSGAIESWASGVLYDNLNTDGQIRLDNREVWDQGVGWAAANCVLWNCTAPVITVRNPPGAHNWVFGCWGQFVGDGDWGVVNEFVKPDSLYCEQLQERLGPAAVAAIAKRALPKPSENAKPIEQLAPDRIAALADPRASSKRPLAIRNGWLTVGDRLLVGDRVGINWWRGRLVPSIAADYGVNLTRFAPGRIGPGLTDDLDALTDLMCSNGQSILAHHWGLWYDERRQDHEMVRRIDADVWPPFYEQAWARSGTGTAWDGLSKYDLTRFNAWYFGRLKRFAELSDQKGLVLVNQMYFQHNVLEAGAHWVDTPWRAANALQDLGFPEPPPFENRKRIFMADAFYDVNVPARREFHRALIRHYLDELSGNSNVIQFIGEEFTGPLAFVQFWLDVIAEWERETGKHPLIGLSCTKDVQDAILADPSRAALVNVIEFKYWWPTAGGKLFAPVGGQSLSPRQQMREARGKLTRDDAETARQIRQYRLRYPDKAILCEYDKLDGWSALAAGTSSPPVRLADDRLLRRLPEMRPLESKTLSDRQWALMDAEGGNIVACSLGGGSIHLDLSGTGGKLEICWIDPVSGKISAAGGTMGGEVHEFRPPSSGKSVLWLRPIGGH